jgi:hypothetical protein
LIVSSQNTLLSDFSGLQDGDHLRLSWTIKAGQTCNGTTIEKLRTDGRFVAIGEIPGVCGDINFPVSYSFTDSFPDFNSNNVYRLELGFQGYSDTLTLAHSPLVSLSSLAYPNPFSNQLLIRFRNPGQIEASVMLIDPHGRLIKQRITRAETVTFSMQEESTGVYYYVIRLGREQYSGSVLHSSP